MSASVVSCASQQPPGLSRNHLATLDVDSAQSAESRVNRAYVARRHDYKAYRTAVREMRTAKVRPVLTGRYCPAVKSCSGASVAELNAQYGRTSKRATPASRARSRLTIMRWSRGHPPSICWPRHHVRQLKCAGLWRHLSNWSPLRQFRKIMLLSQAGSGRTNRQNPPFSGSRNVPKMGRLSKFGTRDHALGRKSLIKGNCHVQLFFLPGDLLIFGKALRIGGASFGLSPMGLATSTLKVPLPSIDTPSVKRPSTLSLPSLLVPRNL